MRAYSMDLRERALLDSDAGMKAADVAAKYRVSGSWVRLLKQRRRETGEVAPRVQRHGRRCMLEPHLHTLAALIAAHPDRTLAESMARASAPTSNRSWCRPCSPATSSLPTISGPTRSPASNAPSRPPGPPSGTCHPTARTSIPSSSASRSSRPSFAPLAVAAPRRSGRSSASAWRTSALTNAATIFGTAGTRPPHGHEKRFSVVRLTLLYTGRSSRGWYRLPSSRRTASVADCNASSIRESLARAPARW